VTLFCVEKWIETGAADFNPAAIASTSAAGATLLCLLRVGFEIR